MFRLIKWLFFLAIIAFVALAFSGEKFRGKTVSEHLAPILGSKEFKDTVRDMRAIVGQGLKAAGEAISEDVTEDERKQLDGLVKQELRTGAPVEVAPGQTALPPQAQIQALAPKTVIARPTAQQLETLPKTTVTPTTLPATPAAAAPVVAAPKTAVPPSPRPAAPTTKTPGEF